MSIGLRSDREQVKISTMLWIFGYGSLIWRPGFTFRRSTIARLRGWRRQFSQGSPDHRGTPELPGRVVNLLREATGHCMGLAFEVDEVCRDTVIAQLDERESGGYSRHTICLELLDGSEIEGIVYIASPENPFHLGHAPMESMAEQIRSAQGPSGHNRDYVFGLESALETLGHPDPHVSAVAKAVRASIEGVRPMVIPSPEDGSDPTS